MRSLNDLFVSRINALLKKHGLSQTEAAKKAGVHQPQLNRWLKGENEPSLSSVEKLASIFGLSASDLLNPEVPPVARVERPSISEELREQTIKVAREAARWAIKEMASRRMTADLDDAFSQTIKDLEAVKDNPVALAAVRDLLKPFLAKAAKKRGESA